MSEQQRGFSNKERQCEEDSATAQPSGDSVASSAVAMPQLAWAQERALLPGSPTLEAMGRQLYHQNPFLGQLAEFMEHPLTKEFYAQHFDHRSRDSTLFFLWLYQKIETAQPSLQPFEKIAVLHHVLHTEALRVRVFDEYSKRLALERGLPPDSGFPLRLD